MPAGMSQSLRVRQVSVLFSLNCHSPSSSDLPKRYDQGYVSGYSGEINNLRDQWGFTLGDGMADSMED